MPTDSMRNDYRIPDFSAQNPDVMAEAELRMTATFLTYARHVQAGRFPLFAHQPEYRGAADAAGHGRGSDQDRGRPRRRQGARRVLAHQ